MLYYISPNFSHEKLKNPSLEDLIDVFEDRVLNWVIQPSKIVLSYEHGAVGALVIIMGYFEGVQIYLEGEDSVGRSEEYFCRAFSRVFSVNPSESNIIKKVAKVMYKETRCGFAHDGVLRYRIFISDHCTKPIIFYWPMKNGEYDLEKNHESIVINPHLFIKAVEKDFLKIIGMLRKKTDSDLVVNFEKAVDIKWGMNDPGPIVSLNQEEFQRGET